MTTFRLTLTALTASVALLAALPAAADMQFSVYGGVQGAPHSDVEITGPTAPQNFTAGWEGNSFTSPPYYGVRGTWWLESLGQPNLGISLDFSHAKVYADDETLVTSGFSHFEMTDGINILTLNALYKFDVGSPSWTPYVGAGAGINVPHIEVTRPSGSTSEYQLGGASLQAQAGIAYNINENWSVFTEYKGNYSFVDVDIDGGDTLKTDVITNAVNFGVSYKF